VFGRQVTIISSYVGVFCIGVIATTALAVGSGGKAPQFGPEFVPGEVIIRLKGSGKSEKSRSFVGKAMVEKSMVHKGSWNGLNMHHFALKSGANFEKELAALRSDPDVAYAEPNYIFHRMSLDAPRPIISMSELRAAAISMSASPSYALTHAPVGLTDTWVAASATTGSTFIPIVAVIDTGIDMDHEVFRDSGAIWTNPREIPSNGLDDDGNGYIDDVHGWNFVANNNLPIDDDGHGTHVSGIVLGVSQNIFSSSVAQAKIRIMPLKFLDSQGSGTTADAVKAIYYAVNNGAKVLNNSWGGGGFSNSLLDAIAFAYDHKVVFVAAAGNASSNNDSTPTYPANYNVPNMISVAATTDSDYLASYSNFGRQTVNMGAPGSNIMSTYPGDMFAANYGTSMATPFVSGIAALMARETPALTGYQIKNLIFDANQAVSSLTGKTSEQSRLNTYFALQASKAAVASPDQPSYNASVNMRQPASSATASDSPAGCGLVKDVLKSGGQDSEISALQMLFRIFAVSLILVAPIALAMILRKREGRNRRKHARYQICSEVRVKCGDKQLVGQVSTISVGGVQLNADMMLEQGGIVKMQISSPDGRDQIEVEGHIVWSEEQKRYGVAFANADQGVVAAIQNWTRNLLKC
jgi:hypothetical protein